MNTKINSVLSNNQTDTTEVVNKYAFVEGVLKGLLTKPELFEDREAIANTYKEIIACFLHINSEAVDVLSYFKTLAACDISNSFYQTKVVDLEMIVATTFNLFSHFHSLAMLSFTGSKESNRISDGFCFAALTALITLRSQVHGLLEDKAAIQKGADIKSGHVVSGLHHPSLQYLSKEGFALLH